MSLATLREIKSQPQPHYATFTVTAYTANDAGMNGKAITASGTLAKPYHTIAASDKWPFGTEFETPSGQLWVVEDRGSAITGSKIDLYVGRHDTATAYRWGKRIMRLMVVRIGKSTTSSKPKTGRDLVE